MTTFLISLCKRKWRPAGSSSPERSRRAKMFSITAALTRHPAIAKLSHSTRTHPMLVEGSAFDQRPWKYHCNLLDYLPIAVRFGFDIGTGAGPPRTCRCAAVHRPLPHNSTWTKSDSMIRTKTDGDAVRIETELKPRLIERMAQGRFLMKRASSDGCLRR